MLATVVPARARRLSQTVALSVTLSVALPASLIAQTTDSSMRIRTAAAPLIRLTLNGDITLTTANEPVVDVSTQVRRWGFTIGSTNARRRGPYTLGNGREGDTVVIRALPRPALRSIGLSFESEQTRHLVQAPERAVLLIRSEGGRVVINGVRITQCQDGLIVRRPDTTLRCVPAKTAMARAMPRTTFLRSGILKLGTGASDYRLYTHVEPTRPALKH